MNGPLTTVLWAILSGLKGLQWKQALFVLALSLFGQAATQGFRNIPVTLHSLLTADYSADAFYLRFPNIKISILRDVLGDQDPDGAAGAYATLQSSLLTPVATVTPKPGEITQNPPSATPTAPVTESSVTATMTPTTTPSPTPSPTPTRWETPTNQPFYTVQPTLRPTLMSTRVKSTQVRPTNTRPPQLTATSTQVPPSQAATPTRIPPTPTKPPHPYPAPTKPPYP